MSRHLMLRQAAVVLGVATLAIRAKVDEEPNVLVFIGAPLIPLAVFGLLGLGMWRRPATFVIRDGVFVAPAHPAAGVFTLILGALAGTFVAIGHPLPVTLAVSAVLLTVGQLFYLPRLTLTPEALIIRVWRKRKMPWASTQDSNRTPIDAGLWHVDETFLAKAIHRYTAHPEARDGIGTRDELERIPTSPCPACS